MAVSIENVAVKILSRHINIKICQESQQLIPYLLQPPMV